MAHIYDWDETKPAGTRALNLGDDDIREFKSAIRERLQFGGMYFPSTDDDLAGEYSYLRMAEQASNPSAVSNKGFLFTKDVSGVTELYYMTDAGTVVQLTSGGELLISSFVIGSEARGDLITRGASAWGRFGIGASGRYLRSDGTDPTWNTLQAADLTAVILTPKEYTDVSDTSGSDEVRTDAAYGDTTLSLTFTVGKQGLCFANFSGLGLCNSGTAVFALLVDGTVVHEASPPTGGVASGALPLSWCGVLSAGSHTIKVQSKCSGGGTVTLKGTVQTSRLSVSHPT